MLICSTWQHSTVRSENIGDALGGSPRPRSSSASVSVPSAHLCIQSRVQRSTLLQQRADFPASDLSHGFHSFPQVLQIAIVCMRRGGNVLSKTHDATPQQW